MSQSSLTPLTVCLSVCLRGHLRTKTTITTTTTTTAVWLLVGWVTWGQLVIMTGCVLRAVWRRDLRLQVDVCLHSGHLRTPRGFLSYLWIYPAVRLQSLTNAQNTKVCETLQQQSNIYHWNTLHLFSSNISDLVIQYRLITTTALYHYYFACLGL